ncbi:serine hydrolase domain-containing protein [Polaromonas sp. AET17H-212]|uniref:serine hydrolase domain-containing protein n=1 Tax=Polaromonas sp. AET17H-212 TaxID=1977061 RepID=UPI000BBCB0D5|nr:serine hydrolase domain-containing protein [Polaromonas sp. AET17H-212]
MTELAFAAPAEVGLCPERLQRLLAVLQADIDRGRLPGAVALVARRGQVALFESLGRQDPAAGSPMTRDSIFRIYSMTKPLVSVAVMMLLEQGRLLLSDPVARHLPEFANQKVAVERGGQVTLADVQRPATVQDLLRHTAGLTYEFLGSADVQRQYAKLQMGSRERSNAEFSRVLAGLPLMYQPGSVWEYSRATDVLGRLVEVLSGQALGEYLHRHIFVPLGMDDTGFSVDQAHHPRIAEPFAHDPDGGVPMRVLEPRRAAAMESGGGGLLSTAMDYARFLQFMRNRGELDGVRLLGSRTVDFMTADHLGAIPVTGDVLPPGYGFGLGFAVRTATGIASVHGSRGLYYWGGIAGTTFFVDPAEDLYAVLMIQAPNQRDHYRPLFRSLVYAALLD